MSQDNDDDPPGVSHKRKREPFPENLFADAIRPSPSSGKYGPEEILDAQQIIAGIKDATPVFINKELDSFAERATTKRKYGLVIPLNRIFFNPDQESEGMRMPDMVLNLLEETVDHAEKTRMTIRNLDLPRLGSITN